MSWKCISLRALLPLLATAAAACGGTDLTLPSESVAAKIAITQGNGQNAHGSSHLPDRPPGQVTDSRGLAVPNQPVDFTIATGGGDVSPASAPTDADGQAGTNWTLGPAAGAQTVTAAAVGNGAPANLSVTFSASALTAAPARLT